MIRPIFGDLSAKAELIAKSKHDAAVQKALIAIRQLGIGVVFKCQFCFKLPYETEDNSFPCEHARLYDSSLRGFGLEVLNAACKLWAAEAKTGEEEIPVHSRHSSYPQGPVKHYRPTEEWHCTECGQVRAFSIYALAHWSEPLTHTCDCGQKHRLQRGIVRRVEGSK